MKNILIILFLLLGFGLTAQTKQLPFISANKDSSGYVSESALIVPAANLTGLEALMWKVGGNAVNAHSILGTNSAYDLIFRTNSTEQMRVLSNGNMGIGINSPAKKLHVNGDVRIATIPSGSSTDSILTVNQTGDLQKRKLSDIIANGGWSLLGNSGTTAGTNFIGTTDSTDLVFKVKNLEAMRVKPSGNVGIGTSSPSYKLHVAGYSGFDNDLSVLNGQVHITKSSGAARINFNSATGNPSGFYFNNNGVYKGEFGNTDGEMIFNPLLKTSFYIAGVPQGRWNTTGLGIGTITPTAKLQVESGNATTSLLLKNNANNTDLAFYIGDGNQVANGVVALKASNGNGIMLTSNSARFYSDKIETNNSNGSFTLAGAFGANIVGNSIYLSPNTSNAGVFTATTGTQNTVNIGGSSNEIWSPSSGSATYNSLNIAPSLNTSGSYSGTVRGLLFNPTLTSTTGVSLRAIELANATGYGIYQTSNTALNYFAGNVGIGTGSAVAKLEVIGRTKTDSLQVTTGASNGYIATSDASGNLSWSSTIVDARLSANIAKLNAANSWGDSQTFENGITVNGTTNTEAITASGQVTVPNATAGTHAMNRNASDARYGQLFSDNSWYGKNAFGGTNSIEALKLYNTKIYATSNINLTNDSYATNGDLMIDANSGQMAMKVNYQRRNFAFGNNYQQNHNISFVDGTDTASVVITDSTRTIRVYKSSAITTSKCKITLPQYPNPQTRLTVLVETDPSSITFFSGIPSAQPIITASNFPTVGVGDVLELWFAFNDGTGISNAGKWYVKKL